MPRARQQVENMKAKLNERFKRFVGTLEGVEYIDSLTTGTPLKSADYLINNRSVIIEQKILTTNPDHKVQKYADKLLGEGEIVANGRHSLHSVFDERPDGRQHYMRLVNKVSSVLEKDLSHADKQLRDTRKIFSIPGAVGVVVLLNEGAHDIDPQLTHFRVEQLLAEKTGPDAVRFPNTDLVVAITDIHTLKAGGTYRRMGFYASPTSPNREAAFDFAAYLKDRWIGFSGEIYVGCVRPPRPGLAKLYGGWRGAESGSKLKTSQLA
jgi:hypothetical protein